MSQTVFIYGLADPETMQCRYIGKSIRPLDRLGNHMNDKTNCHRTNWLRSLKAKGMRPILFCIEEIDGDGWPWQESERFWISYARANGWPLTNGTDGGDGVTGISGESKRRMSATWVGRKHKPETLAKLRIARAARTCSDATRARMSASQKGRKITWGDKLSIAVSKLTTDQTTEIKARLDGGELVKDVAAEFGVHRTTISKIKKGTYHEQRSRSA